MKQPLAVRLGRWFSDHLDSLTRLRILLLLLVLWGLGRGLVVASRFAASGWLGLTTLLGVLLGWLFGRSRTAGWKCGLALFVVGFSWLLLTVGGLAAPLIALLGTLPPILIAFIRPPHAPDFAPFLAALSSLGGQMGTLYTRFALWFGSLDAKTIPADPLVEGFLWALGMWLVASWAAWWLRRRSQAEVALLPGVALLAVTAFQSDAKNRLTWLVLVAGGWLLIHALEHYSTARSRWLAQKMDRVEIEPALAGAVVALSVIAMLAGGYLPGISFEKIIDTIQDAFRSENAAASVSGEGPPGGGTGYTKVLRIGAGQELPPDIVLYITVEGYIPPNSSEVGWYRRNILPETQYYWRSATYSTYGGRGWSNYTSEELVFPADAPIYPDLETIPEPYQLVRQHVERVNPLDKTIYAAGELLSVDHPFTVALRRSGDVSGAETDADAYTAESRLLEAPVEGLRQSGSDYPASITSRYLQLPEELPDRVYDLALDLTVRHDNPYDRAVAIQDYLRQFRYSLDVPAPPPNRDAADFFLFELHQGYCNYYATSMAVLARAVGLPSRLVTGYRTGSYDYSQGRFIVREENLHAWVEIYFAGYGWVEFEPTSGVPLFPRRGGYEDLAQESGNIPAPAEAPVITRLYWAALRNPLTSLGILLGFVLLLSLLPFRDWSLYLQPSEKVLRLIYHRLYRLGRRWGIPRDASRTPLEFSLALASRLEAQASGKTLTDLQSLTSLYTRLLYSPFRPDRLEGRLAIRTWMSLRRSLAGLRVQALFPRRAHK